MAPVSAPRRFPRSNSECSEVPGSVAGQGVPGTMPSQLEMMEEVLKGSKSKAKADKLQSASMKPRSTTPEYQRRGQQQQQQQQRQPPGMPRPARRAASTERRLPVAALPLTRRQRQQQLAQLQAEEEARQQRLREIKARVNYHQELAWMKQQMLLMKQQEQELEEMEEERRREEREERRRETEEREERRARLRAKSGGGIFQGRGPSPLRRPDSEEMSGYTRGAPKPRGILKKMDTPMKQESTGPPDGAPNCQEREGRSSALVGDMNGCSDGEERSQNCSSGSGDCKSAESSGSREEGQVAANVEGAEGSAPEPQGSQNLPGTLRHNLAASCLSQSKLPSLLIPTCPQVSAASSSSSAAAAAECPDSPSSVASKFTELEDDDARLPLAESPGHPVTAQRKKGLAVLLTPRQGSFRASSKKLLNKIGGTSLPTVMRSGHGVRGGSQCALHGVPCEGGSGPPEECSLRKETGKGVGKLSHLALITTVTNPAPASAATKGWGRTGSFMEAFGAMDPSALVAPPRGTKPRNRSKAGARESARARDDSPRPRSLQSPRVPNDPQASDGHVEVHLDYSFMFNKAREERRPRIIAYGALQDAPEAQGARPTKAFQVYNGDVEDPPSTPRRGSGPPSSKARAKAQAVPRPKFDAAAARAAAASKTASATAAAAAAAAGVASAGATAGLAAAAAAAAASHQASHFLFALSRSRSAANHRHSSPIPHSAPPDLPGVDSELLSPLSSAHRRTALVAGLQNIAGPQKTPGHVQGDEMDEGWRASGERHTRRASQGPPIHSLGCFTSEGSSNVSVADRDCDSDRGPQDCCGNGEDSLCKAAECVNSDAVKAPGSGMHLPSESSSQNLSEGSDVLTPTDSFGTTTP